MSQGDGGPRDDYGSYAGYGDYPSDGPGGHRTRTRLPDEPGGGYGGQRHPARPSRGLIGVVGVIVLLIAAIAFANRGGGEGDGGSGGGGKGGPAARPTAPTGERPVTGSEAGIATGFPRTEQGAESAAANYAVALGGDGMFREDTRQTVIETIAAPSARDKMVRDMNRAYTASFLEKVGLEADGSAPGGMTFVSRTVPVGTQLTDYSDREATVAVWASSLFGLAGEGSTRPVSDGWFTITLKLTWSGGDWKVASHSQKSGPAPVRSDATASGAEEIAEAVEGYGGFTYAR
ncbi:hypothetical protein [Streptomyces zingiberis]|uniref:DUF8175 domain-containing protein n=1 Tax=Streptomyces zingiberis TaxID=2053010 RepID=A0ABX1BX92_9ACTN|nr:hypothetical protein [Streptomyces zingiberis]NJQ00102.1 hypothetical protein [Streptomyces zingiberis]